MGETRMSLHTKYYTLKITHKKLSVSYFRLVFQYLFNRNGSLNIVVGNHNINLRFFDTFALSKLLTQGWNILSFSEEHITLKSQDNVVITCRTKIGFDFGHLNEIYLDKSYGSEFSGMNIIDIGMSNADSSIYFIKHGAKYVIGLEPDKQTFDLAVKNITDSKVEDKILPLRKALSDVDGSIELTIYDHNPNANSVDEKNMVGLNDTKHIETVESTTLKDIINKFRGEQIGILKMDCEGCEYSVLANLDHDYYSKIDSIIMEYHNGLKNLPEKLKSKGFNVEIKGSEDAMGYIKAKKGNNF